MDYDSHEESSNIYVIMGQGICLFIVAEIEWFFISHQIHGISSEADEY
jgi:hypothetical protein